jgi:hypothetical protein
MKRLTTNLVAISLLCLFTVGAVAKDKNLKEHMTFSEDLMVGNTLVKKGDYLVKYNAPTSEVSIMEGGKVVATTKATVTVHDKKFDHDALITKGDKLIALRLGGQREEITITDIAANIEEVPISDIDIETPIPEISVDMEINPICEWEAIPLSDDREEIVVSDVDGIIPEAQIVDYKLVCRP